MHTASMIFVGVVTALILWAMLGRSDPSSNSWLRLFAVLWAAVTIGNLWFGVYRAGYGFLEELPINAIVYSVPLAFAFALQRFARRH